MPEALDWRANRQGPGDRDLVDVNRPNELATTTPAHPLDSEEARREHRQLMQWYFYERDRQAANRLDMAIDHDMYDNIQWSQEDADAVEERGQTALCFNEVAPMCDWVIGTERRNRVDWSVQPRTEDDVESADIKTKAMKYVSDINRVPFARSRAFNDTVKGGMGWTDDGARDDPTKDVLYSRYEDWRNVLHDSSAQELDLSDGRYLFRWRWVDEDIAVMMFPDRENRIRSQVEDWSWHDDPMADEDTWIAETGGGAATGSLRGIGSSVMVDAQRRRVKLIECQYRKPVRAKVINSGPLRGAFFNERDGGLISALNKHGGTIIDKMTMRMHVAVFTEVDLLGLGVSVYRHNEFSLTPHWCYRRSRDRMPYGLIRRVRDVQRDLNKRASKALWYLNTNQLVGEQGAFDDWDAAAEEAARPDGRVIYNNGKKFEIRRDTDAATGQLQMMTMDAQSIQKSAGVSQENMGRQTNAVSGEAIKARQLQGAVVTTEPFDNLRLAVQCQGSKQLSLIEQFYTEEKVLRLTGAKGKIEWLKINVPEVQPDGSVRFLNDIASSMADFVVGEQDYAGTLRQVMFDSLTRLAERLPPEVSLRLLTMAYEYSDLPNKDEIADQIRRLTGERDESKPLSPEEEAQAAAQQDQQAAALELQQASAQAALAEQQAKVREINARAAELEAKADAARMGGDGTMESQRQLEMAVRAEQEAAAKQIDAMSEQLRKLQADLANRTMQVKADADSKANMARIQADADVQVAEIQAVSEKRLDAVLKRLEDIGRSVDELRKDTDVKVKEVAKAVAEVAPSDARDQK